MHRDEEYRYWTRRLETVAERLERSRKARERRQDPSSAQELRVAAIMMRDEAKVVARKASAEDQQGPLSQRPRSQTRFVSEPVCKE